MLKLIDKKIFSILLSKFCLSGPKYINLFQFYLFQLYDKVFLFQNMACRYRGSYMSAHVLLNLLNELGKRDKM